MRLAAFLISCATPLVAQDFLLDQPIDCVLDDTCYLQNFVDHDPSTAASDFQCGALTYDTHKGTDFALPSLAAMEAGVDVLAAAPGVVRGVRNDMPDILYTAERANEINGRDCGNGVVIAHEGGWETQYCHLMEGSVAVRSGDRVSAGDRLGQVGLSGRTQFPHLHLSVRKDGVPIDPFAPSGQMACGASSDETLWSSDMSAPAGGLISIGFADRVPDYDDVKAGTAGAPRLSPDGPIVLWAFAFGARPDDIIRISFSGPDGALFQTDDVLTRQQALIMRAGGLNPPDRGWPSGTYTGEVLHLRGGETLDRQTHTIELR